MAALKARDRVAITALRLALAAIDNAEALPADDPLHGVAESEHIAGSAPGLGAREAERRHLTQADVHAIVEKEVGERSIAAGGYEQIGRNDLAERLRSEADVLRQYLAPA
jgi:hypothetical protein